MSLHEEHSVIYDLTSKKLTGEITPEELKQLEEAIEQSEENKKIAADVESIWNLSEPTIQVDTDMAWKKMNDRIKNDQETEGKVVPIEVAPTSGFRYMSIAASIILLLGIFVLYRFGGTPESITHLAQQTEQLVLPDGSKIDLNEGSTLVYPEKFTASTREVELAGTAFFDITKNPEKPFIIHSGGTDIKVLGTSFYVQTTESGNIEVNVKTGTVHVTQADNPDNNIVLEANENAVFDPSTNNLKPTELKENDKFWKTKTLIFRRAPLYQVVEIINSSYNKEVTLGNDSLSQCKLTATFKDNSFEEVLEVLKTTFNITVNQKESNWILNGEGCK